MKGINFDVPKFVSYTAVIIHHKIHDSAFKIPSLLQMEFTISRSDGIIFIVQLVALPTFTMIITDAFFRYTHYHKNMSSK